MLIVAQITFQIYHMKIVHSSGDSMPHSLIGEGGESLLCEKEASDSRSDCNNVTR